MRDKYLNDFNHWAISFRKPLNEFVALIITLGSFVSACVLIISKIPGISEVSTDILLRANAVCHMVLGLFVIAFAMKVKLNVPKNEDKLINLHNALTFKNAPSGDSPSVRVNKLYKRANNEIKQFNKFWIGTWLCWIFLYLIILIELISGNEGIKILFDWGKNLANNLTSLMILYCYITLSFPAKTENSNHLSTWMPYLAIMIGITILELILRFYESNIETVSNIHNIFSIASGVIGGAIIALLIGRLDSKLINAPVWIYFSLYVYAAIQAVYGFFDLGDTSTDLDKSLAAIMMYLALFFKGILLLFIIWTVKTKKLFYYYLGVGIIHSFTSKKWIDLHDNFED